MLGKSAVGSVGMWGMVIVLLSQLVQLIWGYTITPEDQQKIVHIADGVTTLICVATTVIGGIMGLIGRKRATQPITSILPQQK